MKGRYIGECMRLICDLIDKCNEAEILISLDFEKAFDSIEWPFICKSLQFFGFGESIIQGGPSMTLFLYNCSGTFECCTQI